MIQLEIGGRRYPVQSGELVFGTDPACAILLEGSDVLPRHAVVTALPGGGAAIQVGAEAALVRVNGVRLGAEPTPLLHGDKISVGTHDVRVVDERRAGSTQMMAAFGAAAPATEPTVREGGPMMSGRVVCLTDGREYTVSADGLVFGRDAACDVVIASTDVSRRHAEIRPGPQGYVLTDSSANGTLVNGQRVSGSRVLARADVIRIGTEEYRFYASPAAGLSPPVTSGLPLGAVERLNQTLHGVPVTPAHVTPVPALNDTLHGIPRTPMPGRVPVVEATAAGATDEGPATPAAPVDANGERAGDAAAPMRTPIVSPRAPTPPPAPPPAAAAPLLASLLIRGGALKGKRLPVRSPVVNIGRADYNDIVLPEASVSTAHAKLQRREGVWVIADLGSTDGTTVDGEAVSGELPLSPGATIRFGEVAVLFEPMDAGVDGPKAGTRVMPRIEVTAAAPPSVEEPPPPAPRRNTPRVQPKPQVVVGGAQEGSGVSVWAILLFLALAAAAAALVFLR